jgi:site-specific DNA-methyltransferase (adenine-specific)
MARKPARGDTSGTIKVIDTDGGLLCHGDCVAGMTRLETGSVPLVVTDPPYNFGIDYGDHYDDDRPREVYLAWAQQWLTQIVRVLTETGTFWLFMPDELVSEIDVMCKSGLGLHKRSHVIWTYTFGVNSENKLTRSHAHLLYYIKDPAQFTFNVDACRVPSARQLIYNDRRANPEGRLPDDTWIIRPQDLPEGFNASETTWHCPRINGTFRSRAGTPTQIPEQLIGRIVRLCSDEDDIVLDPFGGSLTTAVVAKKLGRQWISFELSEKDCELGRRRVEAAKFGDPLDTPNIQGG